jgi:hypothetical protein
VVAFRQRIVYPGEMIALSTMVRTSVSTCLAVTMMLVVRRLLTRPSSVIFKNQRCTVLDYIKCTYPLVSRLRVPYPSPLNLHLELYYHVNMLGSY